MASKREQIMAAIATAMAGIPSTTGVYRSRVEPLGRLEAPAVVITPGTDQLVNTANTGASMCKLDMALEVQLAVYVRGDVPDQIADPIVVEIHSRLMTDRTIGGLAMDVLPQSWAMEMEEADATAGWMVCTYQVRYRTNVLDLTA